MSRLPNIYFLLLLTIFTTAVDTSAQVDYKLWLQYKKVQDSKITSEYQSKINGIIALGNSESIQAASKELQLGLSGLLGNPVPIKQNV
ncbi:MAG TPA: alpha-glucuronidase family glycosyl hydrolase, partial [Flavobacterium sp.]|nr:alpha-glucuronidase family glycosyl hydrolase [Flavobacterium sp.]